MEGLSRKEAAAVKWCADVRAKMDATGADTYEFKGWWPAGCTAAHLRLFGLDGSYGSRGGYVFIR